MPTAVIDTGTLPVTSDCRTTRVQNAIRNRVGMLLVA
jgi:hypothetical protein